MKRFTIPASAAATLILTSAPAEARGFRGGGFRAGGFHGGGVAGFRGGYHGYHAYRGGVGRYGGG